MNVYVRELSREMGRRGYLIDVFTRRAEPDGPAVIEASPNVRVVHLQAGPEGIEGRRELYAHLRDFEDDLLAFQRAEGVVYDVIHSHYWLSGLLGLRLRERWGAPLVSMFHTLGELKRRANGGSDEQRPASKSSDASRGRRTSSSAPASTRSARSSKSTARPPNVSPSCPAASTSTASALSTRRRRGSRSD